MTKKTIQKHIGEGHRKRLRDKFLNAGLDGFLDYEVVELLLTLGTPRKDCKQPAKEAVKKFKGLLGVLDSSLEELQQIKGIGPSNAFGIKLFQAVSKRYTKEKLTPTTLLNSPQSIFEYLRERIGKEKKEHFSIMCLDTRSNLIIEDVSVGILNASLVHPREVFKKAILNNSSYVVLAHNHPSGDPTPSSDDIITTRRLVESGKILGITVVDHLIITKNEFVSLKEKGFIQ
ncbi:DNA repair protein RadC [Candidatus Woesebacteria bacterium]|nr:MAG: DNA repair protein RadC [Candidatus Woesebacteria bacterium]